MVAIVAGEQYNIIDASDFDKAAGVLFELSEYLGNTIVPMEAAREVAIHDMHERFDTETEPSGYKWFTLTDLYAKRRGAEHPILDDTGTKIKKKYGYPPGTLRKEATKTSNFGVNSESLWYDTGGLPPYWAVHQYGSEDMKGHAVVPAFGFVKGKGVVQTGERAAYSNRPGGLGGQGIPPRPFIGLSEDAEDEIIAIFDRWMDFGIDFVEKEYRTRGGGFRIGDTYISKNYQVGTLTGALPGAGGKLQFRVSGKGFGGRFGPMAL